MKFHTLIYILLPVMAATGLTGCIEDGVTTSASDQPTFSTDTLKLGPLLTQEPSATHRMTIRNRHSKGLVLQRVAFSDDAEGMFRLNVDGQAGREFRGVEIRPNDSIYLFVEATLGENRQAGAVEILRHIEVECNGRTQSIAVTASGRDAQRLRGDTRVSGDEAMEARLYQVYDSIVVEAGARLTIPAGAELLMHDKAQIIVHGTLNIEGTTEEPVNITGDRWGFVAAQIPYEVMSGQWGGITFTSTSRGNRIVNASIRNADYGLVADSLGVGTPEPGLYILNSQIRNTKGTILTALHTDCVVIGCELTDAGGGIVALEGGSHVINHCTLANYYLFGFPTGPALQLYHLNDEFADPQASGMPYLKAQISNSIIYGMGDELNHGTLEGTDVVVQSCALKAEGTDDEQFVGCLWGEAEKMYLDVDRSTYHVDYRLDPASPCVAAGDASLTLPEAGTDRLGIARATTGPSLGAYQVQ